MRGKREIKGSMARRLVVFCISVLTITLIWAAAIYTYAVKHDISVDLSPVLTFVSVAFGGELLMCLMKRIFAKSTKEEETE
jgi:hypothetical protein